MRRRWLVVASVGVVVAAIGLMTARAGGSGVEEEREALHTVRRGDLVVSVRETGRIEPLSQVVLKSKVAGRLLRFLVGEGEQVRPGQLLALIDPVEIQSQVAQINAQIDAARANLSQAQTQLGLEERSTALSLQDARQVLRAAEARFHQASRQAEAQPVLTRAAIDQAEANLAAAGAARAALDDTQTQARADARSALDQAAASHENARKNLERLTALKPQGFVSQNQVDAARRDFELTEAQLAAARKRWESLDEQHAAQRRQAEAQVAQMEAALATARANTVQDRLREDEVEAARAQLAQARVAYQKAAAARAQVQARQAAVRAAEAEVARLTDQLREIRVRLTDTRIVAPMAGTVTRRYVEPGELVTSGIATFSTGTPLLQIADLSRMRVVCQVNEVDVGRVRVGQPASVRLDAARGEVYPGRVVSVAPAAAGPPPGGEPGSQSTSGRTGIVKFEVKIDLDRVDAHLKPGMSASVDIVVGERRGVLILPVEAVEQSDEGAFVTVVRGENAKRVPVRVGLKSEREMEIISGVKEDEKVVPVQWRGPERRSLQFGIQTGE